jgi:predicted enzyme related to lactoylglutathione lyase
MSQPFIWFDHRSENPDATSTFYEDLLGWKRAAQAPPGIAAFGEGEQPWGGVVPNESLPGGWLPYIQVEDLDAKANEATALGASILKPRATGPAGDYIVVKDPGGGTIALWTPPE